MRYNIAIETMEVDTKNPIIKINIMEIEGDNKFDLKKIKFDDSDFESDNNYVEICKPYHMHAMCKPQNYHDKQSTLI